jgi:N-acetylmuramoyl-L-alanine amidase
MWPAFNILGNRLLFISKISLFFAPFFVSGQTTSENIESKLNNYFSKDPSVKRFVGITKDNLLLYSDSKAKALGKAPEFVLSWKEVKILGSFINRLSTGELADLLSKKGDSLNFYMAKYQTNEVLEQASSSLKGLKVAIDPGHIGGTYDMGYAESRCMTLQVDSLGHADSIRLVEGNLTFYTAQMLKKKLEAQGAEVMFARKDTGISALDITYWQWKQRIKSPAYVDSLVEADLMTEKEKRLLRLNISDKELFKVLFGFVDMAERAKKINAFKPDITVIIHYNVNEINTGWTQPTPRDYTMTFVGGCIIGKDLETVSGRLNFLRLLISPDIENSVKLSSGVVHHLSKDLGILIAHKEDATYLKNNCLSTPAEGVYSRDLALTRIIRGTLVYGEALYQDNCKECFLLSGKGLDFKGCNISQRLEQVAQAYFEGIMDYENSLAH